MKLPNLSVIAFGLVIMVFVALFNPSKSEPKKSESVTFIRTTAIDSVFKYGSHYNVYTKNNLIRIRITDHMRFVSANDTLVYIIDTNGALTTKPLRFREIEPEVQVRLTEIMRLIR